MVRRLLGIRDDGKHIEDSPQIAFARRSMVPSRALHAMPQLRHRDCSDFKLLTRSRMEPVGEIETAPFTMNDDVCVENYRHLSASGFNWRRAFRRSRFQSRASW